MWFLYTLLRNSSFVVSGWTTHVRRQWVREIVKTGNSILAVQTLRNWILASTFLATVSMFISFGLLQFIANLGSISNPDSTNTLIAQISKDELLGVKTTIILVCNFVSFFSYSQSIRYFNHVGFAVNIPMNPSGDGIDDGFSTTADHVGKLLNQGAKFFTLGMRGFYFSIPFVFWYFGSLSLIISTVVVLTFIYMGDLSDANISKEIELRIVQN